MSVIIRTAFLIFSLLIVINKSYASIQTTFVLDKTTEDYFDAHFIINNQTSLTLNHWLLGFTFQRDITSISDAVIRKQIGDYYLIAGNQATQNILPYHSMSFAIHGKYTIKNDIDVPAGYFLTYEDGNHKQQTLMELSSQFVIPTTFMHDGNAEYLRNIKKMNTSIEENSITKKLTPITIVPLPVKIEMNKQDFILNANTQIYVINGDKAAANEANYLVDIIKPATSYHLSIKYVDTFPKITNGILLTTKNMQADLGTEGYLLDVTSQSIIIRANDGAGLFYGIQSLRQLLPPQIFSDTLQTNVNWQIPGVHIIDSPRFAYRGVLLDVARHFFTVNQIKRLLDLMAIHKLNRFHWHLTDDEAWRIEIKRYPELTTIGAWRGLNEKLPP